MKNIRLFILLFIVFFLLSINVFAQDAGKALYLDGKDDYVTILKSSNLDITTFTIEAWIKLNNIQQANQFVCFLGIDKKTPWAGWGLAINRIHDFLESNIGDIAFWISENNGTNYDYVAVKHNLTQNNYWYHITATWNNFTKIANYYVNGKLIGTSNSDYRVTMPALSHQYIGKAIDMYFNGSIDDIRLWSFILSQKEIQSSMKQELTGKEENLLLYYNFNEITPDGRVKDLSPYKNHGTLKNGAKLVKSTAPIKPYTLQEEIEMYSLKKLMDWQKQSKFEKTSDFQKRVNEKTIKTQKEKFTEQAANLIGKEKTDWKKATNEYDPDNEIFTITIENLEPIKISVPIDEAFLLDKNFNNLTYQNPQFSFEREKLFLTYLEIQNPVNNKMYVYNIGDNLIAKKTGPSDVDLNIPETKIQQTNTYVLIIGNEDYKSRQEGLRIDQNVDFAVNDAQVFSLYCEKTLGVPNKQIKYIQNATSSEIKQSLAWINNLSKIENGKAKLIFYYSGHGLPDQQTEEAYIIPVDVAGTNLKYAIKLADIYKKLTEHPAKQITVFLDACFSGGARNEELIAMKGVKIKPKQNYISGNFVVFTSSSGKESSSVYHEKQHGYFTYFLLKKLKDTKGDVNYNDLADYIKTKVEKETGLKGIIQTPQVNTSSLVENDWKEWKIIK
ncbi:MAG: caspase family protein [Candidatus Cloacimonetes bacterium]|nr:caspase family protein [Candidatus Cloacimonadota bacterium]